MHEQHEIEHRLKAEAQRISKDFNGAPVVVIVAGDSKAGVPRVMTGSNVTGRLRDLLGILQTYTNRIAKTFWDIKVMQPNKYLKPTPERLGALCGMFIGGAG